MTTRLYHHPVFREHLTGSGHPERPERLQALDEALTHEQFDALQRVEAPLGDAAMIGYAHDDAYVESVRSNVPGETSKTLVRFDDDTVASAKSWQALMRALGGTVSAVDAVMAGEISNAFVASRPPGHHAESDRAMGFCFFNHVAIAARHAQKAHGLERVAIVDFDVHHGNGTQEIFEKDPSVLYASTHQMPLFPGTGAKDETGSDGQIVNAPLSPGDASDHFRAAFRDVILPKLQAFKPQLLLISAGFDAHHRDPLGSINLDEEDFDWVTGKLLDVAGVTCDNRVVSVLEGGYDLLGLAGGAATHIRRLMGR